MRVLVTGGAGFIGSHVVEDLSKIHDVTVLDNLSCGSIDNIKHIKNINFVRGDILDLEIVRKLVKDTDVIVHLAASFANLKSTENPVEDMEINIKGTLNLLNASLNSDIKKFIYASSSSVYGDNGTLPLNEEMPTKPLTPYAVSKLAGENYCSAFFRTYGLKTISLRLFNLYGEREYPSKYRGVIVNFISDMLLGKRPRITGDGKETRDYTYVKDVSKMFPVFIDSTATGIFNIGIGIETTTIELFNKIKKLLNIKVEPEYIPFRKWDSRRKRADITKIRKVFNYKPDISLDEGLKRNIEWLKTVVKNA
jgi:UDP-glucose 4-epimerase